MSKRVIASIGVVVVSIAADVTAVLASQGNSSHGPGTIVVERTLTQLVGPGQARHHQASLTTFTETTPRGVEERLLTIGPGGPGSENLYAGHSIQLYDPRDNTIYVTTLHALQAALTRQQRRRSGGKGAALTSTTFTFGTKFAPGRRSIYEQQLRKGLYRVASHTRIDGRRALKLVPTHHQSLGFHPGSGVHTVLEPIYVSPRTYRPIEQITHFGRDTITTRWTEYRVMPATGANKRLLSLTDRHPTARIDHSAAAYNHVLEHGDG